MAAASVYGADALILGGDIVGKAIVPLVRSGRTVTFHFQNRAERCPASEMSTVRDRIDFNGLYAWEATPEDVQRFGVDDAFADGVFRQVIVDKVRTWCDWAAERLPPDLPCVITPGNDDPLVIDDVLRDAERVECPEGEVVPLGPALLASLGTTNRTPWRTERELDEAELAAKLASLFEGLGTPERVVANFHCPPYRSGLDTVVKLDDTFRPVVKHGRPVEICAGSKAVRDVIRRFQPVIGLHGHIHEAAGVAKVGRTWCINPGSEYSAGVLRGAIVDLRADGSYHDHLLTTG